MWLCQQLLFGSLANDYLLLVSRQSCLSVNDKGDNEMISETMHRSPGNRLTANENPVKPQLEDCR